MKYLFSFLLLSSAAFANNLSYKFGLGTSPKGLDGNITAFSVGYNWNLTSILIQRVEGGVWIDNLGPGHKPAGYGNYSVGINVEPGVLYAHCLLGLALITQTDSQLSSFYEFSHDLGLGIEDSKGRAIGVNYKHLSNAGLSKPNIGRNFIQMEVQIPLASK